MWNPASYAEMMGDDLDVTKVVVLDHITAILYVGQHSAGNQPMISQLKKRLKLVITTLALTLSGGMWPLSMNFRL